MKTIVAVWTLVLLNRISCAETINWGSEFGSVNIQSDGATPVTASFTIELGRFSNGFIPNGGNVDLWQPNWVVFDALAPGEHNAAVGYFTSEASLNDNQTFAAGDQAYVWMFDNQTTVPGSQWLLYTNDAGDGSAGDDWKFPAATGSQQPFPVSWRVSNATHAIFGGLDPDRNNGPPLVQGDGHYTEPASPVNLQTHTFITLIPEPGFPALAGLAALHLLRRKRWPCQKDAPAAGRGLHDTPPNASIPPQ